MSTVPDNSQHIVFTNSDILKEIFSHVNPQTERPMEYWGPMQLTQVDEATKALASSAQTTKALSTVALDNFWAAPRGGLYTLLSLFSAFQAEKTQGRVTLPGGKVQGYELYEYSLKGPIKEDEWKKFVECAARVRELAFYSYYDQRLHWKIHPSVFDELTRQSAGKPKLFPALRSLRWQRAPPEGYMNKVALPLLVGPSLSSIAFINPSRDAKFVSPLRGCAEDVQTVIELCPAIQDVYVDVRFDAPASLAELAKYQELRTFVAKTAVYTQTLDLLKSLPHLQVLSLALPLQEHPGGPQDAAHAVAKPPPGPVFGKLEKLRANMGAVPSAVSLLTSVSSTALSTIALDVGSAAPDDDSDSDSDSDSKSKGPDLHSAVIELMAAFHPFAASLTYLDLSIKLDGGVESSKGDTIPFATAAAPLLELQKLQTLRVHIRGMYLSITDSDVGDMARSWQHIVALHITDFCAFASDKDRAVAAVAVTRPTVGAIVALTKQCKGLVSCVLSAAKVVEADLLKLEQDATTVPRVRQLALQPMGGTGLGELAVANPERLKEALLKVFPSIDKERVLGGVWE